MTYYLAITIGPIEDTLKQARKTRELWAASYIFSALMRELLASLSGSGKLLSPIVENPEKNGAGIFPDRCYLKMDGETPAATIKTKIREAFGKLGQEIPGLPADLSRFFRVYVAQIAETELTDSSPIRALNHILDGLELQSLVPVGDMQVVPILERNIQGVYASAGKNKTFIDFDVNDRQQRLPSLLEIATSELNPEPKNKKSRYYELLTGPTNEAVLKYQEEQRKGEKRAAKHEADAQESALLKLKSVLGKTVKFRHKYVCFVLADGDMVGKTIGELGKNETAIQDFSKELAAFAAKAVKVIESYGAIPIYAGGDDLLFVAPVQNAAGKHIFGLLNDLDGIFPGTALETIGRKANPEFNIPTPTLSFGMSVSYYKYPMFESLDAMFELLFGHTKTFPGKNAVAFRVLKHSGQAFGATIGKGGTAFSEFMAVLTACLGQEVAFLTSVMHKLAELKPFLEDALQYDTTEWFFKHHFNEQEHARSSAEKYIAAVRKFCNAAWNEEKERKDKEKSEAQEQDRPAEEVEKIKPDIATVTNQVYAALRFVQFLNQEDHD